MQCADIQRALFGLGNYELVPSKAKLRISKIKWDSLAEKDKTHLLQKLIKEERKNCDCEGGYSGL